MFLEFSGDVLHAYVRTHVRLRQERDFSRIKKEKIEGTNEYEEIVRASVSSREAICLED